MSVFKRYRLRRVQWLLILSVIGPGIITANVDNDAGESRPIQWPGRTMVIPYSG